MKRFEINGKQYPVEFSWNAVTDFIDLAGKSYETLFNSQKEGSGLTMSEARLLVWCGLKEGFRVANEPFKLSVMDVGALFPLNSDGAKAFSEILELYHQCMDFPEVEEQEQGNSKKPVRASKLK